MVIGRDDVIPLLLEAVPSFREVWETEVFEDNKDGDSRLGYLDASAFARHLFKLWQTGQTQEVRRAFEVIERLHVEGDHYVRELATIGYLEDVQNVAGHAGVSPTGMREYLGPESTRWWNGLNAFWGGLAPAVLPIEETVPDP